MIISPCNYALFEQLNNLLGYDPSDPEKIDAANVGIWRYYARALYQRAISGTDFDLPEYWRKFGYNYFKNVLYSVGFIGVIPTTDYGIIPQMCNLSGFGLFYQPTDIIVGQPLVHYTGEIGADCELIRITPDYIGIWDIINHYTLLLTEAYISATVALANIRSTIILNANSKAAHATLEEIAKQIHQGKSVIISDKYVKKSEEGLTGEKDDIFSFVTSAKEQYIISDLLTDIERIIQQFDREIGIAALGEKKERRIVNEVEMIVSDVNARPETWRDCLELTIGNVNKLFDLNIGFTMRYGDNEYTYNRKEVKTDEVSDVD